MRLALALALPLMLLTSPACSAGGDAADAGDGADVDTYSAGMSKTGALVEVVLVEASPAPPDVGNNTWTLRVNDLEGAPRDDVTVIVSPFMREHGHGPSPPDYVGAATGDPGEVAAGPFDLFMPGLWELTVRVTDEAGMDEAVLFRFDVEG